MFHKTSFRSLAIVIAVSAIGCSSMYFTQKSPAENQLVKQARAIHERVITLDTHIDFEPADLTGARNYTERLETQFNLPNMIDGGLDALFFSHLRRPDPRSAES